MTAPVKPWEGRQVYCSGGKEANSHGWLTVQEAGDEGIRVRIQGRVSEETRVMTRDQARTFAAHMMNLANRRTP